MAQVINQQPTPRPKGWLVRLSHRRGDVVNHDANVVWHQLGCIQVVAKHDFL
jgi:hypothetical protein